MGDAGYFPKWMRDRPWTVRLALWFEDHWKKGKLMFTLWRF